MTDNITRTRLGNGLTVHLKEIHTAPLISHWVWYRVGSRNELPNKTGLSHWVEHMQFKGTPTFPSGVLDKSISRDGGDWNAMTYLDWTAYYETMPANKIELALRLEVDRMVNSLFEPEEVESERTVIISEREGSENEPLFRLDEVVQHTAFKTHAYRHEVIGEAEDLRSIQRDDLYAHYRSHYLPNNAVLSIAGDFDTGQMLRWIEETYGQLLPGEGESHPIQPEPEHNQEDRVEVTGPGETTFLKVVYPAPAGVNPDFFPYTMLDSLLGGPANLNMFGGGGISNRTSRLYRALVERELAVSVSGGMQATIDPFLFSITATVRPDRSPDEVLAALDAEIERIRLEPVTQAELDRAVKQARAMFAYGTESIRNQAFWLGFAEMFAGYDWFLQYLDRLSAVTPADIRRVAESYLCPEKRVVGYYLPTGEEAPETQGAE